MPDQEHLILVLARDAEEITRDMSVFFAPTRDFIEPGADWPPDLGPGELAALIPQLRLTIGHLADVMGQIVSGNKGDPGKARLVSEGVRLIEQGEQAIRAGETLFGAPQPAGHPPPAGRGRTGLPVRSCRQASQRRLTGHVRSRPGHPAPPGTGSSPGPGTRHPR